MKDKKFIVTKSQLQRVVNKAMFDDVLNQSLKTVQDKIDKLEKYKQEFQFSIRAVRDNNEAANEMMLITSIPVKNEIKVVSYIADKLQCTIRKGGVHHLILKSGSFTNEFKIDSKLKTEKDLNDFISSIKSKIK